MIVIYFAYGSNLHLEQMSRRCPDSIPVTQAILRDYKMVYRRGVATIEPSKGDKVYGALYIISDSDLEALDRYEGYPTLYYRQKIKVEARGTGEQEAIAYFMHTTYKFSPPRGGYYEIIEEGYRNWGLPVEHLATTLPQEGIV